MKKETNNLQKVLEYVTYMMVGSYFKKCKCFSSWLESSMLIEYKETKLNTQFMIEEMCIKYVENVLEDRLPKEIWKEQMNVEFIRHLDGQSEIRFISKRYVLSLYTAYKGKYTKFDYQLIKK
ncbi:MAG: hypothetical protein IJA34_13110 [Lachnospiraceae bacterium]|nr:hypothetical protein [Lachnospiraceae bacterium]